MSDVHDKPKRESTQFLVMGLSVGAIGALGAIVGAAACPVCVVATPALLGVGLYKRWKERAAHEDGSPAETARSEPTP